MLYNHRVPLSTYKLRMCKDAGGHPTADPAVITTHKSLTIYMKLLIYIHVAVCTFCAVKAVPLQASTALRVPGG